MSALRFVRATITLYLSKSVRFLRAACLASFLPHADAAHFPSTSAALSAAANASLEGDFSSRSTTREVTARRRSEITQRWMPGASTRTCDSYERIVWVLRRSAIIARVGFATGTRSAKRAIAPEEREKALGRDANGGLGFSVDARGLRRDARHPSRRRGKDTHPVHVHEVDDGDELAVQGVRGQVDQADAPELDVALRG